MISRAEALIFWPGITTDIHAIRANCSYCNQMAPSQGALPPISPIIAAYPFQCICADYFHYQGVNYLVIVDRYSNWPIVKKTQDGSQGLIAVLRQLTEFQMNYLLMEVLSLLPILQGLFCLTGVFTIGLALWPFPIVTVELKSESRLSND